MKIELNTKQLLGQPPSLVLSHQGEKSIWDISAYSQRTGEKSKGPSLDNNNLFDEINAYWAQLSAERQANIWNCYKQAREILDTNYDILALRKPLMRIVEQLYLQMPLAEIEYWAGRRGIRLPASLKDQHTSPDLAERTYLRQDYQGLISLVISLRPMIPIWGEFINSTQKEAGNAYKEYHALALLRASSLMESAPMDRLRTYIGASLDQQPQSPLSSAAVLMGIGSASLPNYILGLTVVRRLAVGQTDIDENDSGLVSNIYHFIKYSLQALDRKIGVKHFGGTGKVKDKTKPDKNPEDQKASIVESYKVKQEVDDGSLVVLDVYTERLDDMVRKVDPTIPNELLQKCLNCIEKLSSDHKLEEHQITLAQWVMHPAMPVRGIPQLRKKGLWRVLAVTQAALWHWGFFDLAALVTASILPMRDDEMRSNFESRARIPKDLMEAAGIRWRYYRQGKGKLVTQRQQNIGSRAVDKFSEMIAVTDWQLHAPLELIEQTSRFPNTRRLTVPPDIRAHVIRLLLKIAP